MNLIEKKKILIKSNSVENENELIKLRNEKLGYIPYEFLNEILL